MFLCVLRNQMCHVCHVGVTHVLRVIRVMNAMYVGAANVLCVPCTSLSVSVTRLGVLLREG